MAGRRPPKTTEVVSEKYGRVKILECSPQLQESRVLLDLIYVIVDEWSMDHSSIKK
jgi:hypothetical protein